MGGCAGKASLSTQQSVLLLKVEMEQRKCSRSNQMGWGRALLDGVWAVSLFPVNKTGESTTINTRHELGVYAQSEHKEAAAKLVEYLLSEEAAVMYYEAQDAMSPRESISQLPQMNKDEYSKVFNEQSATAKPVKITNAMFDNAMSEMSKSIERVLVNHEEIDVVLSDLQKVVIDMYQQ